MLFKTHFLFSLLISMILVYFFKIPSYYIPIILFSSFIPDIDIPTSKIGRKFKIFSFLANKIFEHRGFFHSIIFILIIYSTLFFLFDLKNLAVFVSIGIFSHLFLDSFTKEGVAFLSPFYNKRISGFITVGSLLEKMFFVILFLCSLYFLFKFF